MAVLRSMLRPACWVALMFAVASVVMGQTQTPPTETPPKPAELTADQKKEILEAVGKIVSERVFVVGVDLSKWPEFAAKYQDDIDKAADERTFAAAVNRAFREFGFSHLRLRTPQAATLRRTGPVGAGIGVTAEKCANGLSVTAVTAESSAAKIGIEVGDTIVEVDGKAPQVPDVLLGTLGSAVKIKVQKKTGDVLTVEVQRGQAPTERKDSLAWPDAETAVLKIHSFSRGYVRKDVEDLVAGAAKAKRLVLDLRSNGGGSTDNLRHLLSLLMPPDTEIGSFINKADAKAFAEKNGVPSTDLAKIAESKTRRYRTSKQRVDPFLGKVAVIVNRGSASASEICAAALREQRSAPLIGAKTAGAVLASVYGRLPHGFEIQYPVSDYVTAKGMRLEANPLAPDAETATRIQDGVDEALKRAIELLATPK
jgi:carboxyl-terminal processing protease